MARKKIFKISDEEIKAMYENGASLNDIAKIAQDTKGLMALRARLHDLGVPTSVSQRKYRYKLSRVSRKYHFDEHYFDIIDDEHKAYWLGFLMADGYNHESRSAVTIRIQEEDKELLNKFKKDLRYTGNIYKYTRTTVKGLIRTYCELNLCSPIFSESLAKLGCVQGKTYILQYPDFLSKNLEHHFLRGFFDGDGCLSITHRSDRAEHSKTYQFNIVGRKDVLSKIQEILCSELNIARTTLSERGYSSVGVIHWSGRKVVTKIMNFLYQDATIFMKRKYNKYLELIGNSAE